MTAPLKTRVDRLLDLVWEAGHEPVSLELSFADRLGLELRGGRYRDVPVWPTFSSRLIVEDRVGRRLAYPLPGDRLWLISLDGFADHAVAAPTASAARWRDFCAVREAGYFNGRFGFRDYLHRLGAVRQVDEPRDLAA